MTEAQQPASYRCGRGDEQVVPAEEPTGKDSTPPVCAPTSPSPSPKRRVPFLSPLKGGAGCSIPRRRILLTAAFAVGLTPVVRPAGAKEAAMDEAIHELIGEATAEPGKVKLELPSIVENGNAVPLSVSVESPMTDAEHVESIHIFNQKNPQPYVAAFHLGPRAGKAQVSTRIRLADSQRVVAIARLSDGSFWSDSADVIVTLAACTEQ